MKQDNQKKDEVIVQGDDRQSDVAAIRLLVRAREDFQAMRKRMDNRLGRKADGSEQNIDRREIRVDDAEMFVDISDSAHAQEKFIEKKLETVLKRFPIYTKWLKSVKGVGAIAAAHIIGNIDIEKATTVSKIWQYAGLNPGMIQGKKRVQTDKPKTYEPKEGKVIRRDTDYVIIQTDKMIRGDKLTAGFVSPFNKTLKTALVGVLAAGFIKAQAPYAMQFYYPYKERLANSEKMTKETKRGGKVEDMMWKDCTKGHRDMAAKRFMVKHFIQDLYNEWRAIEGLPIRKPYQEEYLGHKHEE